MLCEKCQKNPATVHMQQFINGAKTELHLCPECSMSSFETSISFENLFQGFLDSLLSMAASSKSSKRESVPHTACRTCGLTYEQFKDSGKLGCADCYQTFSNELDALLKSVQGSIRHEGKYPRRSGVALRQKREAERLRALLNKAVEDENFEEAAAIRDRIRVMEANV